MAKALLKSDRQRTAEETPANGVLTHPEGSSAGSLPALVLASTSTYRRELLARLGLPFQVAAPEVDETPLPGESPREAAIRLAHAKAEAVAARFPHAVVIGSDQTATLDGVGIVGKPGTLERARGQLRAASGRTLNFFTAVTLLRAADGWRHDACLVTEVQFRELDDAAIHAYLALEPAIDCAGSARIEGLGISLVSAVRGDDPSALIGLPLMAVCDALGEAGMLVPQSSAAVDGIGKMAALRESADTDVPSELPASSDASSGSGVRTDTAAACGRLYLVPTPIGPAETAAQVLPRNTLDAIAQLDCFVVETPKQARAVLGTLHTARPLQQLEMLTLDEHTGDDAVAELLKPLLAGRDVGLLSDAGCPAVADPGARLVDAAHAAGVEVIPLVGPSAILMALMASGLQGQRFAFAGYLPANAQERATALLALQGRSARQNETQLWIETPYRNRQIFETVLATLAPDTRLLVASELDTPRSFIGQRTIGAWRAMPAAGDAIPRAPTVFGLLSGFTNARDSREPRGPHSADGHSGRQRPRVSANSGPKRRK